MVGLWNTRRGLFVVTSICLGSIFIFLLVSETGSRYGVPRYVTHLTNKIMILTDGFQFSNFSAPPIPPKYNMVTQMTGSQQPQAMTKRPVKWSKMSLSDTQFAVRTENMTNAYHSRFFIRDRKPVYSIGDRIEVVIETRTDRDEPKTVGGDFFRAKMFNVELRAGQSTDGEVKDLENGSYEAWFTAHWPGQATIEVVLVQTAEALAIIGPIHEHHSKMVYIGKFVNGNDAETTKCNIFPPEYGPMCNMSHPGDRMPWFCQKPTNLALTCSDWRWSQSDEPATRSLLQMMVGHKSRANAINRYRQHIRCVGSPSTINVQADPATAGYKPNPYEFPWQNLSLPPCQPGQHISKPHPTGYFYHDTWYSLHCRIRRHWLASNSSTCLTNTSIQIIGDSSARQVYTLLHKMLAGQITSERTDFLHESENRSGPLWFVDDISEFEVRYNFHGFPIGGSKWFNQSNIMDATTRIDAIQPSAKRVVLILTIGAHFTYHAIDFYEARLRSVKSAVDRLFQRIPDALVIFKSLTAREFSTVYHITANSEWWMWQIDQRMREVFGNDPRIAIIEAWDMTKAMLFDYNIHPHETVVANYISQILTLLCPTGS